jgi:hypothetical protein
MKSRWYSGITSRVRRLPLFPPNWLPSLRAARILWRDYGHLKSVISQSAIDMNGKPLPWYTYPAIEFLQQLDFSEKTVFEYGSGMSTLFWARVAKRVVTVEDDERWYEKIARQAPANCRVMLETDVANVPGMIERTGEQFDVIVVDGPARGGTRLKCCGAALRALRKGGLIILDNSDWLPESSKLLREHGLLEVDMTGFAPICGQVQTTSFYFDRAFNVPPLHDRQPIAGRGARVDNWERPFAPLPGKTVECEDEAFRVVENESSIEFATPSGPRRFLAFTYRARDDLRCIAILDTDRQRVLLARHLPGGRHATLLNEFVRIRAMSWDEYCAFIDTHENRRYPIWPAAV